MSLYIFLLYHIYRLCFTCIDFYDLSAWGGCWFDVYIRRFIYECLNVCPFDYTAVAGSGKVGPVNQVNHTSLVAVVTPTDRPKSVRGLFNRTFLWRCLCCHCPFDISVGVGAFVIGLSQISSFLSKYVQCGQSGTYNVDKYVQRGQMYNVDKDVQCGQGCTMWTSMYNVDKYVQRRQVCTTWTNVQRRQVCTTWTNVQRNNLILNVTAFLIG